MLLQTVLHPDFQILAQTPHVRFHRRKRVHTRLCQQDRTQRLTRRNRGRFGRGGITTLRAFRTFTNIPGPGIRTASFAAFGSWLGVLTKNAESLRNSDAHDARRCPEASRPRWAAWSFFVSVEIAVCMPCAQGLSACARRGVVSLPSARFTCC